LALALAGAATFQGVTFLGLSATRALPEAKLQFDRSPSRQALFARGGEAEAEEDDDDYGGVRFMASMKVGQELDGVVTKLIPGKGVTVDVGAEKEGFVPMGKMSDQRVNSVEEVVAEGNSVKVWVCEVKSGQADERDNKLILSMAKNKIVNLGQRADLNLFKVSDTDYVDGKVTGLPERGGCFVAIKPPNGEAGTAQGLVFKSEMKGTPAIGEDVKVRIMTLDVETNRMSLSMRPPRAPEAKLELFVGIDPSVWFDGKVTNLPDSGFGVFVAINAPASEAQAQGLVYKTEMKGAVEEGQTVKVRILSVDTEKNRMALSMIPPKGDGPEMQAFKEMDNTIWLPGVVKSMEGFGAFVEVSPPGGGESVRGLLHVSEIKASSADGRVQDPAEELEMEQTVNVRVLGVSDKGLRLSMKELAV